MTEAEIIKDIGDYAKKEKLIVLTYKRKQYSNDIVGIAVRESIGYDGLPYYDYGLIYHIYRGNCLYHQQGCYSTHDPMEIRKRAYNFYGIK